MLWINKISTCTTKNEGRKCHDYLPKIWKPFDQLCGIVLVEFDVGEVHFEYGRAWVPYPKEHQLRLAQMMRSQCWRVHRSQGNLLFSNKLFVFFCIVNLMSFANCVFFRIWVLVLLPKKHARTHNTKLVIFCSTQAHN